MYIKKGRTVRSPAERFWKKVDISDPFGCWIWKGTKRTHGYGEFLAGFRQEKGKIRRNRIAANRMSYMLTRGPIPDGLEVLHLCDNPPCVNPYHLLLGTHRDNMADMAAKQRGPRGEAINSAKLKEEDVVEIWRMLDKGAKQEAIAKRFGIHQAGVSDIKRFKRWRHVSEKLGKVEKRRITECVDFQDGS